jgi:hypothetical protein
MLHAISEASARRERLEEEIQRAVPAWRWAPVVHALMALRGLALLHAATLVAELGDLISALKPQLRASLSLIQKSRGVAIPKPMHSSGTQILCPLDNPKPYQRQR